MKNCFTSFLKLFLFLGIFFCFLPAASGEGVVIDRVVAVANREVITQSELDQAEQTLKRERALPKEGEAALPFSLQRDLLTQLIEKRLILQEAKKKGVRLSDSEMELAFRDIEERNHFPNRDAFKQAIAQENLSWEQYAKDLENQLLLLKLMNREIDSHIVLTAGEIQAYYDTHPEKFKLPEKIRLKQVLLRLPENPSKEEVERQRQKAEKVLSEARSGEDFTRLVQEYSDGPEKRQGGDLGYFHKGELAQEIDQAVFGLNEGSVTPIIKSSLGFHLFKIQELKESGRQPFEKVKKEIEDQLLGDKREGLRKKWLEELWSRSFVEVK
jgi:peptidyl-prolyl cis-trans isomerase SurA